MPIFLGIFKLRQFFGGHTLEFSIINNFSWFETWDSKHERQISIHEILTHNDSLDW